ncbi:hypothetical protein G8770_22620 [Aestuariicella hydrocarbonica]|uniref:Uncharacterized protein n=1 Tax=Pseudomaricurvus hydrocarbonicus TaxID=1470433 RepID=A0A9E5T320_9GAMM|nr:hypothetical protein [Aestuariicella hydrocarbonica]NHO68356.1 hypothetical protein [Aestuariicella hydrocarbonica]
MQTEQQSSPMARFLSVSFFLVLTIASLAWFFLSITNLISQIRLDAPIIGFDKGSVYMLGIGLGLLVLTAGGIIQGILGKSLTPAKESLFKKGIGASLVVAFLLPHVVHYAVTKYTDEKDYRICDGANYHWFLYSKFYFTNNETSCDALIREKHTSNHQNQS